MFQRLLLTVPVFALTLLISSCEQASELTKFDISTNSQVTIPATAGVNLPINLLTPDIESNSETAFSNNDTRADLIEEIYLKSCDLEISSPSSANFDFLKSVEVFISTDDLPEVLIAQRQDIQNGEGRQLSLNATGEDLTEYIKASTFSMRVKVVTDEIPGSEIEIDVASVFRVDAKILGL